MGLSFFYPDNQFISCKGYYFYLPANVDACAFHAYRVFYQKSHLYPLSVTPHGGKTESKWRLCLPVGNQFTLALVQNAQGDADEVCKRELQIHLPMLASVTIG